MRDELAVRLGGERDAPARELCAQFVVVFYDAVVYDGDFPVERQVGMCVFGARSAVSRPPRVPYARMRFGARNYG